MRIAYFIMQFPYGDGSPRFRGSYKVGGAEAAAYHLAIEMATRGHDVEVFTTARGAKDVVESVQGVTVHRFGTLARLDSLYFAPKMFLASSQDRPHIVHCHFTVPPAHLAALAYSTRQRRPFLLTYHGDLIEDYGSIARRIGLALYNRSVLRALLSAADRIIVPSKHYVSESRFLARFIDKLVYVPNGVDPEEGLAPCGKGQARKMVGLRSSDKVVLYLGALIWYKGPHVLLKAIAELRDKFPEAKLIMAGKGPMERELRDLTVRLGINDRVIFAGPVEGERKKILFRAADVFVLPSVGTTEVFPLVLLEASAASLPMLVSDLNTFRCIVADGVNGLVTRRGDEVSLSSALGRLLADSGLQAVLGKAAAHKAVDFSWRAVATQTEDLYNEILAGRGEAHTMTSRPSRSVGKESH